MTLSSVLCLSQFPFNLLSINKITYALNCDVHFYPTHCVFQDLGTKQIIGRGHESSGLYVLDTPQNVPRSVACTDARDPSIIQLHSRFDHHSLSTLKKLCPSLNFLSKLECKLCS